MPGAGGKHEHVAAPHLEAAPARSAEPHAHVAGDDRQDLMGGRVEAARLRGAGQRLGLEPVMDTQDAVAPGSPPAVVGERALGGRRITGDLDASVDEDRQPGVGDPAVRLEAERLGLQ